jgi:hypothetical protein
MRCVNSLFSPSKSNFIILPLRFHDDDNVHVDERSLGERMPPSEIHHEVRNRPSRDHRVGQWNRLLCREVQKHDKHGDKDPTSTGPRARGKDAPKDSDDGPEAVAGHAEGEKGFVDANVATKREGGLAHQITVTAAVTVMQQQQQQKHFFFFFFD